MGLFWAKYARRIFAIVSTTSIPNLAPVSPTEATVDPPSRGSRLDADHPENGVLIPRRFTNLPLLSRRGQLAALQLPFDGSQLARGTTSSIWNLQTARRSCCVLAIRQLRRRLLERFIFRDCSAQGACHFRPF